MGPGLDSQRYAQALQFVFDRPIPAYGAPAWWDDADQTPLALPALEWTRMQTALFANGRTDLARYSDEQVGLGLRYLIDNGASDVPYAAIDHSVPKEDAMQMMAMLPKIWRDVIGPRRGPSHAPIGSCTDHLGSLCYMWFDIWPTFRLASADPAWRDAQWRVLVELLAIPCREVQVAALHGIGHDGCYLDRQAAIDSLVGEFINGLDGSDPELASYAEAARVGRVQ